MKHFRFGRAIGLLFLACMTLVLSPVYAAKITGNVSLKVEPSIWRTAPGETRQFIVTATFADGTEIDVTREVKWLIPDENPRLKPPGNGVFTARGPGPSSYEIVAWYEGHKDSRSGTSTAQADVRVEVTASSKSSIGMKLQPEKHAVTLSIQNQSDQSSLDDVQVSIMHPNGNVTLHKTLSGRVEATLPAGAYIFSLTKYGFKEHISRTHITGSEVITFKMSSSAILTSTQQKFLKLAINPTSINMRSGEQRSVSATALVMKGPAVVPKNVSTEATWSSNNPKLVAVSGGVIKSLGGSGVAEIEASYSPDPKLPPMTAICTVRIEEKVPGLPQISIEVTPDKRTYEPGEPLTFKIISSDPSGPWEYAWYMGGAERKGQQTTFTFMDSGKYTVTAIIRSTVDPGKEDAIRKSIEISSKQPPLSDSVISVSPGPPYTAPADVEIELKGADGEWIQWRIDGQDVRRGEGKWAWTFKEKGTHTIKATYWQTDPVKSFFKNITVGGQASSGPIASQINKFDHIQEKGVFQVRSSYWREQDTGFGEWTKFTAFDNIGACSNSLVATGDQSDGYNAGWLIYVPTGKNEVRFKVYGFNFGNHSGRNSYQGSLDLHNKTVSPESLRLAEVHANEVIVEWQGTDGSLGRVRIHKYREAAPGKTGIQELAFTEPRKVVEETPVGFEKIAPGVFVYTDEQTHLTHVKVAPPCEYVLANVVPVFRPGKDFDGVIGRKGILKLYSSYKRHGDWLMRLDQGTYTLPYPSQADAESYGILGLKNYLFSPNDEAFRPMQALADKSPVSIALSSGSGVSTTGTRPIISEVVFKSSRWPIRLQDGLLEIQGERTGHYPWHTEWKQLGTDVETFNKFGTREGPLVVFQAKDRWRAVILNYASGQREKEYSSHKKIEIQRGGTFGAVLLIDERCYEFTPNKKQMAEVDCDSGRYIGKGL